MLVLIWIVALLAVLVVYIKNGSSKFQKRGVKVNDSLTSLKISFDIIMRRQHSADITFKSYTESTRNGERFVGTNYLGTPLLQIYDVDLIKKITVKDFDHFVDRNNHAAGEPLFSRNLFSLKGEEWKDMRSSLSPAFTSSKIRLMVPLIVEIGDQLVKYLKKTIKESNSEYLEVDVKELTTRYTNDVIASCAFGVKVDSLSERNNEFYIRGHETASFTFGQIMIFRLSSAFPWLTKVLKLKIFSQEARKFFTNLVLSSIRDREKNNIIRPDMIHLLMEAKKGKLVHEEQTQGSDAGYATVEEYSIGKGKIQKEWEDVDLVAQAVVFLIAGFDTVSSAMSFLLYELAVNPDVQDRLVEEIKETHAKNGGKFDYNSIQQMKYLDMVVSESMRKWAPVSEIFRLCVKDYNLGKPNNRATEDYIIRKGEEVRVSMWAIQRDPKFFPNPLKFDPERFSDENKHKIKPFTYAPFGLGPRNCIGSRFALSEMKVMAYQLLLHLEVSPGPRTTITTELDPKKVTNAIKGGHWARFKIRD